MLRKARNFLLIFFLLSLVILIPIGQIWHCSINSNYFSRDNDLERSYTSFQKYSPFVSAPGDDTTVPVITFIQPDTNGTIIRTGYFDFIVNITDDNQPLPGNVSIEISNSTTSFFNASMIFNGGSEWFFNWDNISSFTNGKTYIVQVWAKDSSSNENVGLSNVLYVILDVYVSNSPSFIAGVLYIIVAIVIIALIIAYFNKRGLVASSKIK